MNLMVKIKLTISATKKPHVCGAYCVPAGTKTERALDPNEGSKSIFTRKKAGVNPQMQRDSEYAG